MMTIKAQYAAEQAQAEKDHHTPTAFAMTDHIIANLQLLSLKVRQFSWYIKGPTAFSDQPWLQHQWQTLTQQLFDLGAAVVTEGGTPASSLDELRQYTMLESHGEDKYRSADELMAIVVADLTTALLFIDRAIVLAAKEQRVVLAAALDQLKQQHLTARQQAQARLGQTALAGLVDEDDADED